MAGISGPSFILVSCLDLPSSEVGGTFAMGTDGINANAWWRCPENCDAPLIQFIDGDPERCIFGLRRIEIHSNTLIPLERWFTASGQTRITVVGPLRVKRWFRSMSSQNPYLPMLGLRTLRHVQARPLTSADLEDSFRMQS